MNPLKHIFRAHHALLMAVMLFTLALSFGHIVDFWEYPDEVWTVWQVQGSLADTLARTPFDWSPLFPAVVWLWVQWVGNTLETARLLNPLLSALTLALLFQVGRLFPLVMGISFSTTQRNKMGIVCSLAYGVMAFPIFIGVESRAYGLLMLCGTFALWLTLRWLYAPSWRLVVGVAIAYALMFYTSYTSLLFVAFLVGMSALVLLQKYRNNPRWRIVTLQLTSILGLAVMFCLPEVPHFWAARGRVSSRPTENLGTLPQELFDIFQELSGTAWFVIFLGIVLTFFLLWQMRNRQKAYIAIIMLVWTVALPTVIYFTGNEFLLRSRYVWWIVLGIGVGVAWVLTIMPWRVSWIGIGALVILPFTSQNFAPFRLTVSETIPFRYVFTNLVQNIRPDDVLVIDPKCTCGRAYEWDYFVPQYFPSGYLPIVEQPSDYARVWYVSSDAGRDEDLRRDVEDGRIASTFYGPWYFLVRLYERPDSVEGVAFGGTIALHHAEIIGNPFAVGENEQVTVRLQWSALSQLNVDYSISVALFQNGVLVNQADGAPSSGNTSSWQVGQFYEDMRTLQVPVNSPQNGDLEVRVTVYQWWDGVRLAPAKNSLWQVTTDDYLVLKTLTFWAW